MDGRSDVLQPVASNLTARKKARKRGVLTAGIQASLVFFRAHLQTQKRPLGKECLGAVSARSHWAAQWLLGFLASFASVAIQTALSRGRDIISSCFSKFYGFLFPQFDAAALSAGILALRRCGREQTKMIRKKKLFLYLTLTKLNID